MEKKLIHFIFNLQRGGAETMLVRVIKELPEYEHLVVTIFPGNNFGEELQCKWICLNINSLFALPLAVVKFKKLVKEEKPALVHTHLFWPTVVARLSVPKAIPLITTIHSFIATSVEYKHWYVRFLDKLTYKMRKSTIIVVAKGALTEYFIFLNIKPYKAFALYTFVDLGRFNVAEAAPAAKKPDVFKLVSVGALRLQKNYSYIINAMALIKDKNIELDIYGTGNLNDELQKQIDATGAKVHLKGEVNNIEAVIPQYHLFVMSSTFEGFSLGVLEAMAMRIPLLLSNIASFKEQCEDLAWYFSLANMQDAASQILALSLADKDTLFKRAEAGRQRAINNFTLEQHIAGLRKIYDDALYNNY